MYEFSHGGAWFKWSAFDRAEKRLTVVALAGSSLVGAVIALKMIADGYTIGALFNSRRDTETSRELAAWMASSWQWDALVVAVAVAVAIVIFAWWRLSIRQDEMFNRVQNWAIGRAAAAGLIFAIFWWLLSLTGWVGAFPLGGFLLAETLLITILIAQAVRRWG